MSSTPVITVVGVGALGSHVVPLLRNLSATVKAIDFDRVEQKNVLSQFHAKTGVGKSKVLALQQTMQFLFGTKLQVVPHKLTGDNVATLLSGSSVVVDCLDNAEARKLVQIWVRLTGTPCLHGALAADGALGRAIWDADFVIDSEGTGRATCEGGEHLPFISLVSSYLAFAVQSFVRDGLRQSFHISPTGAISL